MRLRGRGRLRQAHARAAGEGRENAKSKRAPRHAAAAASIRRRWRREVLRIMLRLTCSLVACWLDVAARVALLTRPLPSAASERVGRATHVRAVLSAIFTGRARQCLPRRCPIGGRLGCRYLSQSAARRLRRGVPWWWRRRSRTSARVVLTRTIHTHLVPISLSRPGVPAGNTSRGNEYTPH